MDTNYLDAVIINGIYSYIRGYQPCSAAEIASQTGCARETVDRFLAALVKTREIAIIGTIRPTQEPLYGTVSSTLGYKSSAP